MPIAIVLLIEIELSPVHISGYNCGKNFQIHLLVIVYYSTRIDHDTH